MTTRCKLFICSSASSSTIDFRFQWCQKLCQQFCAKLLVWPAPRNFCTSFAFLGRLSGGTRANLSISISVSVSLSICLCVYAHVYMHVLSFIYFHAHCLSALFLELTTHCEASAQNGITWLQKGTWLVDRWWRATNSCCGWWIRVIFPRTMNLPPRTPCWWVFIDTNTIEVIVVLLIAFIFDKSH